MNLCPLYGSASANPVVNNYNNYLTKTIGCAPTEVTRLLPHNRTSRCLDFKLISCSFAAYSMILCL